MVRFSFIIRIHALAMFAIFSSAMAVTQKSPVLNQFYQAEYQNWREYIDRYRKIKQVTSFDVTFYHIDVDIAVVSRYIRGKVLCNFTAAEDNLQQIKLNLHHSLGIESIIGNIKSYHFANDTITVSLDRAYQIGETANLTITYQGVPELAGGYKGLRYETHAGTQPIIATLSTPFLAHYWWPCKDGPGDKPDSVYIDITIPDTTINGIELIAVSNGVLENIVTRNGKKTFQWRERYPIVTYYVMAAISNYQHFQQTYHGKYGENFPIDYWVFSEHLAAAQQGVAQLPEAMALFSDLFGDYPFQKEKYGMTQLGFYGAIENQTNTITNNMSLDWLITSVHELAHMWFGDMITCADWHHGWLNEGFATYCEALWAEHLGGFSAYQQNMALNEYLDAGTLYLQDDTNPFQIFIDIIYSKGAFVLHMLRHILGDVTFFACLSQYARDPNFRYDHATTEDFRDLCERVAGTDLDSFFQQWVYEEGHPHYEVAWGYRQETDGTFTVDGYTRQIQRIGPIFKMPVDLAIFMGPEQRTFVHLADSELNSFSFNVPTAPTALVVDKDNWLLNQTTFRTSPEIHVARSVVAEKEGDGDGYIAANETATVIFEIFNQGLGITNLQARLSTKDPDVDITRDIIVYDYLGAGQTITHPTELFEITTGANFAPHVVKFKLAFSSAVGYGASYELGVPVGRPGILAVEDDGNPEFNANFATVFDSAFILVQPLPYDSIQADYSFLSNHAIVIWDTGSDDDQTISQADQDRISAYLADGGKFVLFGQNIGKDLVTNGDDVDRQFFENTLHASFFSDNSNSVAVQGVVGDIVGQGLVIDTRTDANQPSQESPDVVAAGAGALTFLTYLPSKQSAAIRFEHERSKIAYFGIGLNAFTGKGRKNAILLLTNLVNWLESPAAGTADLVNLPEQFELHPCYPNPFYTAKTATTGTSATTIEFVTPLATRVEISIYNILGQKVRTLLDTRIKAGSHCIEWNGRDDGGRDLAGGVYLVLMKANQFNGIQKFLKLN